jgi:formate dehydrogenase subunit gamma
MGNNTWILKHPLTVRIFHYLLVASFIPLAASGLVLSGKPFGEQAMNLWMRVHVVFGVVLTLDVIAFFTIGLNRAVLFIKRAFTVSTNDFRWFAVLGGYPQKFLLRKKVAVPPMGKYNSGQKLFGVCVIIGGAALIGTGWTLWALPHVMPRGLTLFFGNLHLVCGWGLTLFLLVHIFLGIYMFADFKAMFLHGKIPFDEAEEVAPLWVANELVTIRK